MEKKPPISAIVFIVVNGLLTLGGLLLQQYLALDWDRNWLGKGLGTGFALGFVALHPLLTANSIGLTRSTRYFFPVITAGMILVTI